MSGLNDMKLRIFGSLIQEQEKSGSCRSRKFDPVGFAL